MLPQSVRMRSSDDFTRTVRGGVRVGTPTVVIHGRLDPATDHGPLIGFVVSKAVGTAVTRNRVKRRLRHLMRDRLNELPMNTRMVLRANPAAASRPLRLGEDVDFALAKVHRKLQSAPADASAEVGR